jgi:hypothetical protein
MSALLVPPATQLLAARLRQRAAELRAVLQEHAGAASCGAREPLLEHERALVQPIGD